MVFIYESFIATSLPDGTLIKFRTTWYNSNFSVNVMCFPYILLQCAAKMLQAQICVLSFLCYSLFVFDAQSWVKLLLCCDMCIGYKDSGHLLGQLNLGLFWQTIWAIVRQWVFLLLLLLGGCSGHKTLHVTLFQGLKHVIYLPKYQKRF